MKSSPSCASTRLVHSAACDEKHPPMTTACGSARLIGAIGHLQQLGVLLRRAAEEALPARLVPHFPVPDAVAEVLDRLEDVVLPLGDVAGRRAGPIAVVLLRRDAAGRPTAADGRGWPGS